MSFKYTSRHQWWYATQESHGTTYVVLTLSLLVRPVWPSTYDVLVSLSRKKKYMQCASSFCHICPTQPKEKRDLIGCCIASMVFSNMTLSVKRKPSQPSWHCFPCLLVCSESIHADLAFFFFVYYTRLGVDSVTRTSRTIQKNYQMTNWIVMPS